MPHSVNVFLIPLSFSLFNFFFVEFHLIVHHKVVENLKKALSYVANEHQQKMLEAYIQHFTTGNIETHKVCIRSRSGIGTKAHQNYICSYKKTLIKTSYT